MRVLIDGHNALFAIGIRGGTHEQQRHGLLRLVAATAPHATVYFDARDAPRDAHTPASELGVRVVYCTHREADAAILEVVRDADEPRKLLVVSNDRELQGIAAQHGARSAAVGDFFKDGSDETESPESRELPRTLRGRWRFTPADFGLPDYVDLENPDIDDD